MNREIKEVVKLLAEIDKICKREGIPYYLGPQLTLCCVTGQEITSLMQAWSICGLRIWSAFVWL